MVFRKALDNDKDPVWELIKSSNSGIVDSETSKSQTLTYWFNPGFITYIAELDGKLIGSFIIREIDSELSPHIAHAIYVISPDHTEPTIDHQMVLFSLAVARDHGFLSIQFDLVVTHKDQNLQHWEDLGFNVIGEHETALAPTVLGDKRVFVMARRL